MEVVLSDVDPRGDLRSHSGFCLPAQIAHGAVLDLASRTSAAIRRLIKNVPLALSSPQPGAERSAPAAATFRSGGPEHQTHKNRERTVWPHPNRS